MWSWQLIFYRKGVLDTPHFLNFGYHPTAQADLQCGNEVTSTETVAKFL